MHTFILGVLNGFAFMALGVALWLLCVLVVSIYLDNDRRKQLNRYHDEEKANRQ